MISLNQTDYKLDGIAILLVIISFFFIGNIIWVVTLILAFFFSIFASMLWWKRIKETYNITLNVQRGKE